LSLSLQQNCRSSHTMSSFLRVLVLSALLFVVGVQSHSYLSSLMIDGTQLAEGDCLRPIPNNQYDYPISSKNWPNGIYSANMTCGNLPEAAKAAKRKCPVNPGSTIGVQWHYEQHLGDSDNYYIAPDHKGPCITYLAKSETGAGSVWFKIFEDGFDTATQTWCVDRLRANKGKYNFKLPTDITPGNYLMRIELIALHEGFQIGGAQPYVHCAEISIGGSGTVNPSNLVAFPGAYSATDAGINFNIYASKMPAYPMPGPALYVSKSSASPTPASTSTTGKPATSTSTSTTGKPATSTSTSTTGKPATSTSTTGSDTCTGSQNRCVGEYQYQVCDRGVFAAPQLCQSSLVCKVSPSSNNAYCVRPGDTVRDNSETSSGSQMINSFWIAILFFSAYFLL